MTRGELLATAAAESSRPCPQQSRRNERKRHCTEAEERPHLRFGQCRSRWERGRGEEQGDGEADRRGDADDHQVGETQSLVYACSGQPSRTREQQDADWLAEKKSGEHEVGARPNLFERHAGSRQAKQEQGMGFDLTPSHPLVMGGYLMTAPGMVGMVIGFLFLDERDARTLTALRTTPLSMHQYWGIESLFRCCLEPPRR